jgi:hypothetical protein
MTTTALAPTGCSYWSAQLSFSAPITARHYCLLGNNRYAAPTTFGVCNNHDPTDGSICSECVTLDGTQKRPCNFVKGHGPEIGIQPPASGYDDVYCPVGYEEFFQVAALNLACPSDSVLVLEILPTLNTTSTSSSYDFTITTPSNVQRIFEAHQCLTGRGGRDCGEDTLTLLAYEQDGICDVTFRSGSGYKVQCDNGLVGGSTPSSAFLGSPQQTCFSRNALSCLEVMQYSAGRANLEWRR